MLENRDDKIIVIEVILSKDVDKKHISGLIELKELCENKFK